MMSWHFQAHVRWANDKNARLVPKVVIFSVWGRQCLHLKYKPMRSLSSCIFQGKSYTNDRRKNPTLGKIVTMHFVNWEDKAVSWLEKVDNHFLHDFINENFANLVSCYGAGATTSFRTSRRSGPPARGRATRWGWATEVEWSTWCRPWRRGCRAAKIKLSRHAESRRCE